MANLASSSQRLALIVAACAACALPIEARAAMALCEPSLAGETSEDRDELQAKKGALASWVARAGRYGEPYTRWGIAWNRRLDCTRTDGGLYRCTAIGHPCTIRQMPEEKVTPLRRGTSGATP